ncbi:MAG: uracil-DNA glycosylase family protein [Bacteroidales bacterium]|jgi:G:T/U-mismatch repair DNA glycosylase|nr:uracil-DNA glycosylase family protein [Bacteroidales bacterium]
MNPKVEKHPLKPFLPHNAGLLMLGSFPPDKKRWSMDFFYPNFINDMWRIMGIVFFNDREHFILSGEKRFDIKAITEFCNGHGIAIYDTASSIIRLKNNASDNFLKIVERTDIRKILEQIPQCRAISATGEKAAVALSDILDCKKPDMGGYVEFMQHEKPIRFYRMPSTSRAYPLAMNKKAAYYEEMFKYVFGNTATYKQP